jgi:hypothetical protein
MRSISNGKEPLPSMELSFSVVATVVVEVVVVEEEVLATHKLPTYD